MQSTVEPFSRHLNLLVVESYQTSPFARVEGAAETDPGLNPACPESGEKVCFTPAAQEFEAVVNAAVPPPPNATEAESVPENVRELFTVNPLPAATAKLAPALFAMFRLLNRDAVIGAAPELSASFTSTPAPF